MRPSNGRRQTEERQTRSPELWPLARRTIPFFAHVAGRADALAESNWLDERIAGWVCTWQEHLPEPHEAELAVAMRRPENTGRPLGDETFVKHLGALLGRDLLPKKRGPKGPRRKPNN